MLGDDHLGWRQVDHLPGPFDCAAGQRRPAVGTGRQGVHDLRRGLHPRPARPRRPAFAGPGRTRHRFARLQARHPHRGAARRIVPGPLVLERPDLGGELGDDPPHLGLLGGQGRKLALPVGEGVAQVQDDPDQIVAGSVVQITHGPILRPRCPQENPSPQI